MTHQDILYKELAKKYNMPVADIEKICRYQFKFLREKIESPNFPSVRLAYWGVYKPLPGKLKSYLAKQERLQKENKHETSLSNQSPV